jgi:hypothetical protein
VWLFVEADIPTNFAVELLENRLRHPPVCPARPPAPETDSPSTERIAEGEFDPNEGYEWPAT